MIAMIMLAITQTMMITCIQIHSRGIRPLTLVGAARS
jgi:hypothetical protein